MQFKSIVGQQEVKDRLIKSVTDNRIAHAQLFVGQEGTGKLAVAIAYAQYICCQKKGEDDSCGTCPSCHKFEKLIHPDLHFVFPVNESKKKDEDEEKSGKGSDNYIYQWRETILENPYVTESQWYSVIGLENKLGIISTSESSEVIKKISLKSFESEYKTMVIWLPERMNHYAANKLLKLIEEPPAKTLFILISDNPNSIISTILSRTQLIKFPPVNREDIAKTLVGQYSIAPEKAQDISRVANGSFQTALTLMQSEDINPYFELMRNLMRLSFANDVLGLINWVDKVSALGRERQKELLNYSLRLLRESFMFNLGLNDIAYVAGEEEKFSKDFSPFVNGKNVQHIYNEFNLASEHIARYGNPQIVFTDMAMKMVKLIDKKQRS